MGSTVSWAVNATVHVVGGGYRNGKHLNRNHQGQRGLNGLQNGIITLTLVGGQDRIRSQIIQISVVRAARSVHQSIMIMKNKITNKREVM